MERISLRQNPERGQTLVIFALAIVVIIGFVALTIDVGLAFQDRRHFQNTADAAALAGAAELPSSPIAAVQKARGWVIKNGVAASEIKTIEVRSTDFANDTMYVELEEEFDWIFAQALNVENPQIGAEAAAQVYGYAGGHGIMPWGLLQGDSACLNPSGTPILNADCVVKVGASDGVGGWTGALDLDGSGGGASEYRDNIIDGESETNYCARGEAGPGCTSEVDALDGNKVGPTGTAIDARLSNEPTPGCDKNGNGKDDFNEVFAPSTGGGPAYTMVCPDSPRVIFIPVVSYSSTPVKTVSIEGWALAYLDFYGCVPDCGGSGHFEVHVKVAETSWSLLPEMSGRFNPATTITARRLVQ